MAGGAAGCNYQFSNIVIGVEGDASWTNKSGSAHDLAPFNINAISTTSAILSGAVSGIGTTGPWAGMFIICISGGGTHPPSRSGSCAAVTRTGANGT